MVNKYQTRLNKIIEITSRLPRLLILLVISLLVIGGIYGYKYGYRYYDDHYSMVNKRHNITPVSNKSSVTPSATTQPAPSVTPTTTQTPQQQATHMPQTQATYPSFSGGVVTTSPTCHYEVGHGEIYYRDVLVQALQTEQASTASEVSSSIDQYENQSGEYQYSYQQELDFVNNFITDFNDYIDTEYSQYAGDVNSIGCNTTIDTTNIPQVPACTDLSGTVCFDSIYALAIPSLE